MGNSVSIPDPVRNQALLKACREGQIQEVTQLISEFKSNNWSLDSNVYQSKDTYVKYSALWIACARGHEPIARTLLDAGANPLFKYDSFPCEIRLCACGEGSSGPMCRFCEHLGFLSGVTPFWIAYYMQHQNIIQLLTSYKVVRPQPTRRAQHFPKITNDALITDIINAPVQISRESIH